MSGPSIFESEPIGVVFLAEYLIGLQSLWTPIDDPNNDQIFENPDGERADKLVERVSTLRPYVGKNDLLFCDSAPLTGKAESHVRSILADCNGLTYVEVANRVQGELIKCVSYLKDQIAGLAIEVEAVTAMSVFAWCEVVEEITDTRQSGDDRLRLLQRVGHMLDLVGAAELGTDDKPHWDSQRRQLEYRGEIVKSVPANARNQIGVLAAFEEQKWPAAISDPLPPENSVVPSQRLRDTVKNLNKRMVNQLVRFRSNGTGRGVIWEPVRQ